MSTPDRSTTEEFGIATLLFTAISLVLRHLSADPVHRRRAVSARVLNRVVVMDDCYSNLWSFFGSRPWRALLLAYDVIFVAGIVVWMRRWESAMPRG